MWKKLKPRGIEIKINETDLFKNGGHIFWEQTNFSELRRRPKRWKKWIHFSHWYCFGFTGLQRFSGVCFLFIPHIIGNQCLPLGFPHKVSGFTGWNNKLRFVLINEIAHLRFHWFYMVLIEGTTCFLTFKYVAVILCYHGNLTLRNTCAVMFVLSLNTFAMNEQIE